MRRQAKNNATNAAPMKIGRYGSSTVRLPIHAPLNPKATKTSVQKLTKATADAGYPSSVKQ